VADLVVAFDAALDRPIPVPPGAPAAVVEVVATAPWEALQVAAATARQARAAALILFGSTLDPLRASPAQAAQLRGLITGLAADGCRTIWLADEAAECANIARALAEPESLSFVTPVSPLRLEVRGVSVEICSARGPAFAATSAGQMLPSFASAHTSLLPAQRRFVIGWDDVWSGLHGEATAMHGLHAPLPASHHALGSFFIWGTRALQPAPAGVHQIPALQARSSSESSAGMCAAVTLTNLTTPTSGLLTSGLAGGLPTLAGAAEIRSDLRTDWREVPTHRVAWRTLSITSLAGGDEELATAIWSALEGMSIDAQAPLQIVRCAIDCGGSISRRVHVGEISAESLARLRHLYDPRSFQTWCQELEADRGETLAVLVRNASAAKSGETASFASALAELVLESETTGSHHATREAAWLALELMEST
jgi:hypothetical protein